MAKQITLCHEGEVEKAFFQTLLKPKLLLVEGNDDKRFFEVLFKKFDIQDIQIINYNGKEGLHEIVMALPKRPDFNLIKAIGITRDADLKTGREVFEIIQEYLKKAKLPIPSSIDKFSNSPLRTGIYIFPDCENKGELEDLCFSSIPNQNEINCVNTFIECSEKLKSIKKKEKAKLYAWLSVQKDSNLRLGEAADANLFDFSHTNFSKLITFLKNL